MTWGGGRDHRTGVWRQEATSARINQSLQTWPLTFWHHEWRDKQTSDPRIDQSTSRRQVTPPITGQVTPKSRRQVTPRGFNKQLAAVNWQSVVGPLSPPELLYCYYYFLFFTQTNNLHGAVILIFTFLSKFRFPWAFIVKEPQENHCDDTQIWVWWQRLKLLVQSREFLGPNSYHEEGGVICVGGASGGVYDLNTHTQIWSGGEEEARAKKKTSRNWIWCFILIKSMSRLTETWQHVSRQVTQWREEAECGGWGRVPENISARIGTQLQIRFLAGGELILRDNRSR